MHNVTQIRDARNAHTDTGEPRATLAKISALVRDELAAVERSIQAQLSSDVALISQMGAYIVAAGGKRIRPLTLLLSSHATGYEGQEHVPLAAVVELIHTATLLHDDVVDDSTLRRGRETANAVWGNAASVLVGDFIYSRSFEMMVAANRMRVMEIMAETTNAIAEGEVLQLLNTHSLDVDESGYFQTITRKTARLFQSAAELGAVLSGASRKTETALSRYGLELGIVFQLVDDILDYSSKTNDMGKNAGDDLAEGKPTLPVIYAFNNGDKAQQNAIENAVVNADRSKLAEVLKVVESTGALAYTLALAQAHAAKAQQALAARPDSDYRFALSQLVDFAVARSF